MGQRPKETARGTDYLSYLLRLWQESGDEAEGREAPEWRASLTSPMTGERVGFASLEDLVEYLQEQTCTEANSDGIRNDGRNGPDEGGWSIQT